MAFGEGGTCAEGMQELEVVVGGVKSFLYVKCLLFTTQRRLVLE